MSVRLRLFMLVLCVVVPSLAATVWLVASTFQREKQSTEVRLRETARALSMVVDRELGRREAVAWTLATSPSIASRDFAAFHAQAREATQALGGWVVLYDGQGMLLNTSRPFGAPLARRAPGSEPTVRTLASGATISDLLVGPLTGRQVIAISVPVPKLGPGAGLSLVVQPDHLQRVIEEQHLPADWTVAVVDRSGMVVARQPNPQKWIGHLATADLRARLGQQAEGLMTSITLEGVRSTAFFSRVPSYGWTFVIGVPDGALGAGLGRSLTEVSIAAGLLMLLALASAVLAARGIAIPAQRLRAAAEALKSGAAAEYLPAGVPELDTAGLTLTEASRRLLEGRQVLERRVAAAVEETRQAQQRLATSQRLEALGRLTGGVAHDVNNLLSVVGNNVALLKRQPSATSAEGALQAILRAVDTGRQLTQKLLSFARQRATHTTRVDLRAWLPNLIPLLQTSVRREVVLQLRVSADVSPVEVDASELEVALLNLAVNSSDAMAQGGQLTISAYNDVHSGPVGMVVIAVQDSGTGIDADTLPRVFEPFFTTKDEGQGSGLGLSQVHGFCTQSGGFVHIDSTPGRGTTVLMWLPAAERTGARRGDLAAAHALPRRRLLYVEDNVELVEPTRALLTQFGYAVEWVPGSESALERLEREKFDIVLSDVATSGGLGGLGFVQRLRAVHPSLPVVLLSAHGNEIDRAVAAGYEVLRRPCSPEELTATLARVEAIARARH
ncbi:MAG TPA: ATP-binding protein [Burkholderiaceae bacterium]|nr:ATP-binding protein [Burkholderiaceae bacterium]